MELVTHNITWSSRRNHKPVVIAPIGDIQWSGKRGSTAGDILKRHIDKCMKLDAWFVGTGDFIDFMSPSNRQRFKAAALYDAAEDVVDDAALELVHGLYEDYLKPTKGRWLGCVPLTSEILTRSGWKHYNEVAVGDDVLAYDSTVDLCRWTPLRGIVTHLSEPLLKFTSRSFTAVSTPDHRWYGMRQVHLDGSAYGRKGMRRMVRRADALKSTDRICVSASAEGGSHGFSPREAAILGWLVTDGTIFWHPTHPSQTQGFIYQTKPKTVAILRQLLGEDAT